MKRHAAALALGWALNGLCLGLLSSVVYRDRLEIAQRLFPYLRDALALTLTLWLTALLAALPGLLLSWLALSMGRTRLAYGVAAAWGFVANAYLLSDAAALSVSGSHLLYFLGYVSDILAHPELQGLAWIGGAQGLIGPLAVILASSLLAVVCCLVGAERLLRRPAARRWIQGPSLAALALLVGSPWLWSDLLIATAVYQQLPIPTAWLLALESHRFARGVKMVELTNSLTENDQVVIHNFGPPVDLQGWRVLTRSFQGPLSGTLGTGEELTFPADFAAGKEWVALQDAQGKLQDTLQYTPASGAWVSSLPYPRTDPKPLAEPLTELQQALRQAVVQAIPPDPEPRVRKPKNVVIIMLESFRRDALTPQSTPELSRWSEQSLRLEQHFAGCNGTHLSLYSILFGRSALFYRRDLSVWTPPQLIATLKASGYQTSYFSSATSVGWLWMERMLAPQYFDRIELGQEHRSVDQWHRWNIKDAEYLAEIPELLRTAQAPQLVVLFAMSSHYPYPFPPEYDLHQPSLGGALNTSELTHASQEILKNRYANAAAYLDSLLGKLLGELDLNNTLVVITGDHGEGLWDDGNASHGTRLSQAQVAVPCLILGAGTPARAVTAPTYHADLLPTLLHILEDQPVTIQGTHGASVLGPLQRDSVPVTGVVTYPPYELALFSAEQRLKFSLSTPEWFSGRIGGARPGFESRLRRAAG
jgi:hypothetical protein